MSERDRVLVIDDSTTLRKLVEIALRGTPTDVDFASSGADGIRRATAHPPHVILLDYMLPDMGGVDVCARLAEAPATAVIPIVIMSAKHDGVREAFRAFPRVVDFVAKPFAMDEIRSRLGAAIRGRTPPGSTATTAQVALSGDLATTPLLETLRFLSLLQLTGCVTLELASRIEIYVRGGDVVLCTSHSLPGPADLDDVDHARAPRAAIDRAAEDQRRTGKPALASLAEAGYVAPELAPLAIRDQGARILATALDARAGALSWRSLEVLPDHVETFGRPQAVTGIALERHRAARSSEVVPAAFLDAVYARTPRFSSKLAGARLSAGEQKLLALFDGETPMSTLLQRTGLPTHKAASVCNRLCAVDLIELRDHAAGSAFAGIALWNPDDGDFERSLRAMLERRAPPIEVLDLSAENDLTSAILRARPRLILVTRPASARTDLMLDAARATSSALVAVVDTASRDTIDACLAAGFHAVLAKPVHINDLERLLSS